MSGKRFFGFGEFGAWVRDQITGVMDALNLKADKTSVHTKQEALETFLAIAGKAVDSSLLDGKTKAQIILEAIEAANNASAYTAGDVLAKLLTVDGPNSGLNADVLDGKQLATIEAEYKAFTNAAISALVDSSPDALNTLNELATALGNDPNFATTITNQLASKVDKTDTRLTDAREWSAITITQSEAETGTATTRRAWTAQRVRQAIAAWWAGSADKTKLDGIAAGATANSTDATLLNRSNHTGTQSISTVSGLQTALDSKLGSAAQAVDSAKLEGSTKAQVVTEARTGLATTTQVAAKLDATANAVSATKLQTARTITLAGDVTGSASFDGSANVSISATVANDSHTHDTRYPVLSAERVLTGVAAGSWVTIAQVPSQGGRAYGEFIVYDTDSSKHNIVKIIASHSYGQSVVACVGGNRFGTRTIAHVRVLHGTVDRTYDGAKLQVYIENTCALRVRALMINQISGWSAWSEMTPVVEGTPAGWVEDTTTRYDDITNTATGFSGSFSGNGALLTGLNAANLASGTIPDARLSGTYTGVNITGNAATATKLQTARTINGVAFDGTANITVTAAANGGTSAACSGNAATATALATARTINGVAFNGTANITVADSTKLPLAGGSMTGPILFADNGSDNGIQAGNGNNASSTINNLKLTSWFGIGFGPSVSGQPVPLGEYSHWMNVRNGDMGIRGSFTASGNVTAYSDIRLKTDIQVIPDALAKVEHLRGVTYTRIETGERQTGVIAQEVQSVLPEAVRDDGEHLSVAYGNMVGLLIEAIKELNHKVDRQAREIAELRAM